jgi:hypothetical protein
MNERFRLQMFYPVEGDSAIVELMYDDAQWADMRLEDLRLDAVGDARLEGARVVVSLFPKSADGSRDEQTWWEFDYADVRAQLDEARDWLLDNERGRESASGEGLTAAGEAFTKISRTNDRWHPKE